jgi:hypothetical protein
VALYGPHSHHPGSLRRHLLDLSLGSAGFENEVNKNGERLIWLDRSVVQRLNHLPDPSETMSDVILRFLAQEYPAAKI